MGPPNLAFVYDQAEVDDAWRSTIDNPYGVRIQSGLETAEGADGRVVEGVSPSEPWAAPPVTAKHHAPPRDASFEDRRSISACAESRPSARASATARFQ